MTELARLDNFQDSDPELVVVNIRAINFGSQTTVYTTEGNSVYRLRVLTIAGNTLGTVGTLRLGAAIAAFGGAGQPWTNGSNNSAITATVPQDIPVTENFNYTWSTETTSAYYSNDVSQGWVAQAGLPLVFIPPLCQINITRTRSAGGDGNATILDGFLQIEKFPLSALQSGGDGPLENVYLLPQTI